MTATDASTQPTGHLVAEVRCVRTTVLPHRKIQAGEIFARLAFKDPADRDFFRRQLKWSAFHVVDVTADQLAAERAARKPPGKSGPPAPAD